MSTLTIEITPTVAERIATLRPVDKMRLDNAVREVVHAVVFVAAPQVSDEASEDDIESELSVSLARQTAFASERTLARFWDSPEDDEAYKDL